MGRRTRKCYLCGETYKYCPTCSQDLTKPIWMSEFHSEDCMKIFDTCTRYNMDMMSKSEAQEILNSCDLSNRSNFKSYVQHDLDVIFTEDPIVVEVEAKIEEIVEDKIIVDVAPVRHKTKKHTHEGVEKENE